MAFETDSYECVLAFPGLFQRDLNALAVADLKKRDFVPMIQSFMGDRSPASDGKIMILYGLLCTGKTTAMEQALLEYPNRSECVLFEVNEAATMQDILDATIAMKRSGVRVLCFDEITKAEGFMEGAAVLADVFAKEGMRIILTGTDSLALAFAEREELFDRTVDICTTHISFAEHCRVLGINDIDDYIRYGGVMRRDSDAHGAVSDLATVRGYLDRAVTGNIVRSIQNYNRSSVLDPLSHNEMRCIIEIVVKMYSGTLNAKAAEYPLRTTQALASAINADRRIKTSVTDNMILALVDCLRDIDVFSTTSRSVFRYSPERGWKDNVIEQECYIIQPALKYYHLAAGLPFDQNESHYREYPDSAKAFIEKKEEEDILGAMTEQIIRFDTNASLPRDRYKVTKPVFFEGNQSRGELGMIVFDKLNNRYDAFGITHTKKPFYAQAKHLVDPVLCSVLDQQYGGSENVCVLYNGRPFRTADDILYLNIADFSLAVKECRDMEIVFAKVTRNLPVIDLADTEPIENYV